MVIPEVEESKLSEFCHSDGDHDKDDNQVHLYFNDNGSTSRSNHIKNHVKWTPLTLSLVEYERGDILGLFFALSSLAPLVLQTNFIILIIFRRDLLTICFYLGFLLNEPLNMVLKHIFREPRPMRDRNQFGKFGMPSSHAQHSSFFVAFAILFLIVRTPEVNMLEHIGLIGWLFFSAWVVAYGRIYLKYHTRGQVLVGIVVGSIYGGLWFILTQFLLTPLFPSIVSWSISEYLLIRDTTNIKHLFWFEYNNTITYDSLLFNKIQTHEA